MSGRGGWSRGGGWGGGEGRGGPPGGGRGGGGRGGGGGGHIGERLTFALLSLVVSKRELASRASKRASGRARERASVLDAAQGCAGGCVRRGAFARPHLSAPSALTMRPPRPQGKTVRVSMKNGVVFEGVFHTANVQAKTEAEFGVALAFARKVEDPKASKKDRTIHNMLVINAADFIEIEARDLPMATGKSGALGGFTDTEISGSRVKHGEERELTKWEGGDDSPSLSLDAPGTEWDQFATNEKKFGVTTTYNERMYTTDLNKSTLTPAQIAHAEKMAREIEGDTSMNDNIHVREDRGQETEKDKGMDEEDRHSSVLTKDLNQRHDSGAGKKEPAKKPFKLNANAQTFQFNPGATAFQPGGTSFQAREPAALLSCCMRCTH